MPFHPMWLPPPWWLVFAQDDERDSQLHAVSACLQNDGGFGNWPSGPSYLECCFQAFVALNALDAVADFSVPSVRGYLTERAVPSGGFADEPGGRPTLFNTFYATICFNMLGDASPGRVRDLEFIDRLRVTTRHTAAYSCQKDWRPELIATYWAVAARHVMDATQPRDAISIGAYLDLCWNEQDGAYGASPGHAGYMEYTYCALAIGSLLGMRLTHDRPARITAFIAAATDPDSNFFGERAGTPGTLSDSMWATACLAMLGTVDELDLRAHRRAVREWQPTQLWHLHCQLAILNYLDQAEPQLTDKIVGVEHIPIDDGYSLVSNAMHQRAVVSAPPIRLDVLDRTPLAISGLLDDLASATRSRAPTRDSQFAQLFDDLVREVTAAFLPRSLQFGIESGGGAFVEFMTEAELLTIPLELALTESGSIALRAAVGRLIRSAAQPADSGDRRVPTVLRVLLLGGSHRGRRVVLPTVQVELDSVVQALQLSPRVEVTRLEARGLTRKSLRDALAEQEGRWDVVHFAGHTFGAGSDGNVSGIVLSDGELEARVLLEWCTRVPRFVFIHGCSSSRTKSQRVGVTHLVNRGIASTFALAGASYLGSYWPIRDVTSAVFAGQFYARATRGVPLGEAVRLARLGLRGQGAGPCAWAGYCLVGSPRMRLSRYRFGMLR
jgi:prenyltransferase beta subunit